MGQAEGRSYTNTRRAPLCTQINFPLLYPDVSDAVSVAVSIKIPVLSVISLSLAAAGQAGIDLIRLLSSKIPSARRSEIAIQSIFHRSPGRNNRCRCHPNVNRFPPLHRSTVTRVVFSFSLFFIFYFFFFNRQPHVHFSSTTFHLSSPHRPLYFTSVRVIYAFSRATERIYL